MRTLEQIREDVHRAMHINDAASVMEYVAELDAVETPQAAALNHRARGWALFLHDEYASALGHFRKALELFEQLGDRIGVASTMNNIGSVHYRSGDLAAALAHHRQALAINEEIGNRRGVALAASSLGNVLKDIGNYDEAREYYHRALAIGDELDEYNAVARTTGNLGIVYYSTGDYNRALECFQQAVAMHKEQGDRSGVASSTGNIGNVYASIGNVPSALEHYHLALSMHKELGERSSVALITTNIGVQHFITGDYPAALEHYHDAVSIYEELGNGKGVAYTIKHIGLLYLRTGKYDAAMEQYQRALTAYELLGERSSMASSTFSIGELYDSTGDQLRALEHYRRALSIHEELGERGSVARVMSTMVRALLHLGSDAEAQVLLQTLDAMQTNIPSVCIVQEHSRAMLLERSGDLDSALAALNRALNMSQEWGQRPFVASTYEMLRDLAFKRNDLVGYVEHNNEFTRITEEINGKDTATKLAMQGKQREIDAREREHEKQVAVLHSTLPKEVAERVARGEVVNDHFENASVIFLDIVGFTELSSQLSSQQVIELLDDVFSQCDAICAKHNVTKIKTIGDSYMCVSFDSVINAAHAAMEMSRIQYTIQNTEFNPSMLQYRIGVHCGPVTAGVIGKERMQYDVWGDTVNVASRMESSGEPGRVHVSEAFASNLQSNTEYRIQNSMSESENQESHEVSLVTSHSSLVTIERGSMDIKGKGLMNTYWLEETHE
jgi:adenylate cyclase